MEYFWHMSLANQFVGFGGKGQDLTHRTGRLSVLHDWTMENVFAAAQRQVYDEKDLKGAVIVSFNAWPNQLAQPQPSRRRRF